MIQYQQNNLTIFESALFRTTSTLFHNKDLILLADPTWLPREIDEIRKAVNALQDGRPLYLLFTHSDYDHIIADQAFPEAQTIASQAFVDNPEKEKTLQQIIDFDQNHYIKRNYPIVYPDIDHIIQEDGQSLQIGSTKLIFYQAPGHNPDGIYTLIESAGLWIAGDYLSNIEFPYLYHSSRAYEATMAKTELILAQSDFQILVPGHGDVATTKEEVLLRKKESMDYIEQLKSSISGGEKFDLESLWRRYDFPVGMLPFHQGNVALFKKEWESGAW